MTNLPPLDFGGHTDKGRVRRSNEDSIGIDPTLRLVVLADGMGGYNAGEVASAIAVKTVRDSLKNTLPLLPPGSVDKATGLSQASSLLRQAIINANTRILELSTSKPQYRGMGTTVVAAVFHIDRVSIAHVGDSRAYRLRNHRLEQLTVDHSLNQELLCQGELSAEEVKNLGQRHVVTRALGVDHRIDVDVMEDIVKPEDVFLFCSDGLYEMISIDEMTEVLTGCAPAWDSAAKNLVAAANAQGGKDNISVVVTRPITDMLYQAGQHHGS